MYIFTDNTFYLSTYTQLVCYKLPKMEIIITKCRNFEFQINSEPPTSSTLHIACRSCVFDCVGCACTYLNKLYVLRSKCRSSLQLIVFLQNISIPFCKSVHAERVLHDYISKLMSISLAECMYKLRNIPIPHHTQCKQTQQQYALTPNCELLCKFMYTSIPCRQHSIGYVYHFTLSNVRTHVLW